MKNSVISLGSWETVKIYCGNGHKEPVEMVLQQGPYGPFYACPKYDLESLEAYEHRCNNRLTIADAEKLVNHLTNLIFDAEMEGRAVNLTNKTWKDPKGTEYRVLRHEKDNLEVAVVNHRAINS